MHIFQVIVTELTAFLEIKQMNLKMFLSLFLSLCPPQTKNIMYDAARVPSPKDGANAMAKPVVPGAGADTAARSERTPTAALQAKTEGLPPGTEEEEEEPKAEPALVKKPHREILDHDRKRRVELKCMELQEMMEEQG